MTQGGSGGGFSSGDDFVAARVSIDVPTEGIQTLKEMSNAINNFRTAVETAGRGSSSFVGMLQQMTQAANMASEAHRNLSNQLQQTADMQQRMQTGGVGGAAQLPMSRNAPQGFVDNFAGMGIGMGSGGSRLSPSDVPSQLQSQQIDPTRQLDPRKYLEAQAGRNRTIGGIPTTPTGAPDWGAHADRVEQRDKQQREQEIKTPSGGGLGSLGRLGGLAGNMAAEMSVGGGSHAGMLGLAARGMGMIGHHIDASAGPGSVGADSAKAAMAFGAEKAEGMGIGSLVKGGAGALGIGLAGLGAVEKGGAMFQGYRNMGMIQGGGAGAGLQDEMQIRSMALNPFLTTEQSRQIVMAGLTEGYKGGQFDSVTQFIASNLKEMNLSVADSVGVLRKNITEGGQSITGFNASMATLREMAKGGTQSLPDLQQRYLQTTQGLISNGVGGGVASEAALNAAESFGDDRMLAGSLGSTMSAISQNPMGGMMQMAFGGGPKAPPGLDPRMYGAWAAGHGGSPDQLSSNMIVRAVKQAFQNPASRQKGSGPWYTAVGRFQTYMMMWTGGNSPFGPEGQDVPKAEDMCEKVLSGQDPASSGKAKRDEVTQKVNVGSGGEGGLNSELGFVGSSIVDAGKMFLGGLTGNDRAAMNAADDIGKNWDVANYEGTAQASNPVFENVVRAYGPNGIEVDAGQGFGKVTGHKDQMEALAAGKAKWRRKGDEGSGITLGQTPGELQSDFRTGGSGQGGGQTKVDFGPADVKISFGPQGQPTASPNPVRLTPNQQAANSGQGGASMNNPPPGDGFGYYQGRGGWFRNTQ